MSFLTDMHIVLKTVRMILFRHEPNRPFDAVGPVITTATAQKAPTLDSGPV